MSKTETNLQIAVSDFLRYQYPNVIFLCDMSAGMRLSIGMAVRAKRTRSSRGLPDIFIAQKSFQGEYSGILSKPYSGLFLELKKLGTKIYLKDGTTMVADPHIREQAEILIRLRKQNYKAEFVIGLTEAISTISIYLSGK